MRDKFIHSADPHVTFPFFPLPPSLSLRWRFSSSLRQWRCSRTIRRLEAGGRGRGLLIASGSLNGWKFFHKGLSMLDHLSPVAKSKPARLCHCKVWKTGLILIEALARACAEKANDEKPSRVVLSSRGDSRRGDFRWVDAWNQSFSRRVRNYGRPSRHLCNKSVRSRKRFNIKAVDYF